jgi:exopolyphosphatase/guanosine-5'-triphosphate,3'-diphosphate pyrophosphatase
VGTQSGRVVAAVDLGSNSFHLIVARLRHGSLTVIDRLREPVRLGAGLDENKRLIPAVRLRALECLRRFGQRVRHMPKGSVRAVGTNALRQARDAQPFLTAARRALGHPVEIVAGREEARLIYLGVAFGSAGQDERRLVVDIGGGSTELIVGRGFHPMLRESLHIGSVSASINWFREGRIRPRRWREAVVEAELALEPVAAQFRRVRWQRALGASGSIRAVATAVQGLGWCRRGITRPALRRLADRLIAAGDIESAELPGLSEDRMPIFAGGAAILTAVFELLGIEEMEVSPHALREGVLYDLVGRIRHEDIRAEAVNAFALSWGVDLDHALRVRATAWRLFDQAGKGWKLSRDGDRDLLGWAAQLHEVGLQIAHNQYHKHGAYIIANADLAGFSKTDQLRLATLVRGHRRKFAEGIFDGLPEESVESARRLCVLLRLAVLLHRSRLPATLPRLGLRARGDELRLALPRSWLERHPLTRADFEHEVSYLRGQFSLRLA